MQFKANFEGVWRKEFDNYKIEVKNDRGSEKKDTVLTKKERVFLQMWVAYKLH